MWKETTATDSSQEYHAPDSPPPPPTLPPNSPLQSPKEHPPQQRPINVPMQQKTSGSHPPHGFLKWLTSCYACCCGVHTRIELALFYVMMLFVAVRFCSLLFLSFLMGNCFSFLIYIYLTENVKVL